MKLNWPSVNYIWLIFFAVWCFLLTGTIGLLKSPGLKQWESVRAALKDRRQEIAEIESKSAVLSHVAYQLEFNSVAQEREIRKVLGYLGAEELVFEFESK